jgi:hypothetical protein
MTTPNPTDGDTERTTLLDMVADHLASAWLKLKYPLPYRGVRYINGYVIEIGVREFRKVEGAVRDEDDSIAD